MVWGVVQLKSAGVQVDLVLELVETGDKLTGHLEYCSDLFSPETATRMAGHLQVSLREEVLLLIVRLNCFVHAV